MLHRRKKLLSIVLSMAILSTLMIHPVFAEEIVEENTVTETGNTDLPSSGDGDTVNNAPADNVITDDDSSIPVIDDSLGSGSSSEETVSVITDGETTGTDDSKSDTTNSVENTNETTATEATDIAAEIAVEDDAVAELADAELDDAYLMSTSDRTIFISKLGLFYDAGPNPSQVVAGLAGITFDTANKILALTDIEINGNEGGWEPALGFTYGTDATTDFGDGDDIEININGRNVLTARGADHAIQSYNKRINFTGDGTLVLKSGTGALSPIENSTAFNTTLKVYASENIDGSNAEEVTIDNAADSKYKYVQIGGENPGKESKKTEEEQISYNIIKEVDLGKIGDHQVSVNYTTNVKYDGRSKVQKAGTTKSDKKESKSVDPCIDIKVLVDGKALSSKNISATFKYNKLAYNKRDKQTVSGAIITLKIDNKNEYGKEFGKAVKKYFKENEDALVFYILPDDLEEELKAGNLDISKTKSSSKVEGSTVKKVGTVVLKKDYGSGNSKKFNLKWDKKNTDGKKVDAKKDFYATVSSNGQLIITGENSFTGQIILDL